MYGSTKDGVAENTSESDITNMYGVTRHRLEHSPHAN
jgi:hypothetical protein